MINRELTTQLSKINDLISKTDSFTNLDLELQAHWAKYLCVLIAGFLENSLKEIFTAYVSGKANTEVTNFSRSTLSRVQNPKTQRFIDTTTSFSTSWGNEIEEFVADEGRKEAINSIMSNRHLIAHGKNSTITMAQLKDYLAKSIQVINKLESLCNS